jgi:hypothetical protein
MARSPGSQGARQGAGHKLVTLARSDLDTMQGPRVASRTGLEATVLT